MKAFFILLSLVLSLALYSQNLVPNCSFEQYKKLNCETIYNISINHQTEDPKKIFDSLLYDWTTPTDEGGVELFSTLVDPNCYKKSTDCFNVFCTTNPFSIHTVPKDGNNFCLITLIDKNFNTPNLSRSYLQVQLVRELSATTRYLAGLYYKRPTIGEGGIYACNNQGMLFTKNPVSSKATYGSNVLKYTPQVNQLNADKADTVWKKLFGCFTADGGEQFLTIGNFFSDDETKVVLTTSLGQGAYYSSYAVDSVFTESISDLFIPNVFTPNGDNLNEKFVIKDIHFGWWSLTVVNRWGKQVFYSNDYRNTWDGKDLDTGVYYYELQHRCSEIKYKGSVTILR
ncbi:MAG: gliding motility-associated C-terminal domain-containing protein [Bacteroidetes bacterium]|nr:gliding motility-associated C-terminal domain-containing protein [Bacteroidota bacterium]